MAQRFWDDRVGLRGLQISLALSIYVSFFLPFSLSMVAVVVRLYAVVVLLFEVLKEENPFEEFSTDSKSALVSSPVSSNNLPFIHCR